MAGQDGKIPKEMKDLLMICTSATDPEAPNANTSFHNLTDEDKQFLESALNASTVNPVMEIKKCLHVIMENGDDEDNIIESLENLQDWCGKIDFAIDFHKVGGFNIFERCITHEEAEVQWQLLALVATISQNNPYCQQAVLADKVLNLAKLLQILDSDPNTTVKTKALYAISCVIRENPEGIEEFIKQDGFSFLMRAMQTSIEKLQIKSAFLLSAISSDNDKIKDILCDMGMLEQLISLLHNEHCAFHEHLMSALLAVVKNHPRSRKDCLRPELNLLSLLRERQQQLQGKEQYKEEMEYTGELMTLLEGCDTEYDVAR